MRVEFFVMKPRRPPTSRKSSASIKTLVRLPPETEQPQGTTPNSSGHERIPPQWAWHYRTLLHLRDRLMRAHAEHSTEAVAPADRLGVDVADTAQEQTDRDVLWAELGNEADKLFEIDCALQRIHDGVYGFCEESGHAIPPERLRAIPWTRYCRTTAEQRERRMAG
jgi:RNA polymerase-binding transcription factor DksA